VKCPGESHFRSWMNMHGGCYVSKRGKFHGVHLDSHCASGMAKTMSRLIKHHAQPSPQSHRNFVISSNTSKHVRKVFTPSASSSSPMKQQSQPEKNLLDGGHPIIVDDLDSTPANIDYPANISVCTKAKRYQNLVW